MDTTSDSADKNVNRFTTNKYGDYILSSIQDWLAKKLEALDDANRNIKFTTSSDGSQENFNYEDPNKKFSTATYSGEAGLGKSTFNEETITEEQLKKYLLKFASRECLSKDTEKAQRESLEKAKLVEQAIKNGDIEKLKKLACTKYGLVNTNLRRDGWGLLLHSSKNHSIRARSDTHQSFDLIEKDCRKAFINYPRGYSEDKREAKQTELELLLKAVFQREPKLVYYEGFCDIAGCFLLVLGRSLVANALQNAMLFYFRDSLIGTILPKIRELELGYEIIRLEEPRLANHMQQAGVKPYYGIAWVLGWFSKSVKKLSSAARLFDTLLASNPYFPVYIAISASLYYCDDILRLPKNKTVIHALMARYPLEVNVEDMLKEAFKLQNKYPLQSIQVQTGKQLAPMVCSMSHDKLFNSIKNDNDYITSYSKIQNFLNKKGEAMDKLLGISNDDIADKPSSITVIKLKPPMSSNTTQRKPLENLNKPFTESNPIKKYRVTMLGIMILILAVGLAAAKVKSKLFPVVSQNILYSVAKPSAEPLTDYIAKYVKDSVKYSLKEPVSKSLKESANEPVTDSNYELNSEAKSELFADPNQMSSRLSWTKNLVKDFSKLKVFSRSSSLNQAQADEITSVNPKPLTASPSPSSSSTFTTYQPRRQNSKPKSSSSKPPVTTYTYIPKKTILNNNFQYKTFKNKSKYKSIKTGRASRSSFELNKPTKATYKGSPKFKSSRPAQSNKNTATLNPTISIVLKYTLGLARNYANCRRIE